ncbi:MAG: hypothetical protein R3C01_11245 [Planctomycetaceae bacterium]
MSRVAACSLIVMMSLIVGCGGGAPDDAPDRFTVTGTVQLDGAPLAKGSILFLPEGGTGRPDGAEIVDGKYELKCTPGAKRVEITAQKEIPAKEAGGMPTYETLVPEKYNTKSELKADVKSSDDNVVPFDLKSK